jgi:ABC-type glycerol-3-phosphate transport system substrate-binding protein
MNLRFRSGWLIWLAHSWPLGLAALELVFLAFVVLPGEKHAHSHAFQIAFPAGAESDVFRELSRRFCEGERITCRLVELDYDNLYKRELDELLGGAQNSAQHDTDDVITVDDPWLPRFIATGNLVPLSIEASSSGDVGKTPTPSDIDVHRSRNEFPSILLSIICASSRGMPDTPDPQDIGDCAQVNAVPVLGNVQLLEVNPRLFSQPPAGQAPCTKKEYCSWEDLINAGGSKSSVGARMVLRGGGRNPYLTDFMPILKQEDPLSLSWKLSVQKPAFTPASIPAFEKFMKIVRQAPESYSSISDTDSQALILNSDAAYAVTWSNTVLRAQQEFLGLSAANELHFDEIIKTAVPGGHGELGVWLLAIPKTGSRRELANRFLAWIMRRKEPDDKPEDVPLLFAAIKQGNPPTVNDAYDQLMSYYADSGNENGAAGTLSTIKGALASGFARPREENWDCMRHEISDALKELAESAEVRTPGTKVVDHALAADTAKQLALFIACIQMAQENTVRNSNESGKSRVCDADGLGEMSQIALSCRQDKSGTIRELSRRIQNDRTYDQWRPWVDTTPAP